MFELVFEYPMSVISWIWGLIVLALRAIHTLRNFSYVSRSRLSFGNTIEKKKGEVPIFMELSFKREI